MTSSGSYVEDTLDWKRHACSAFCAGDQAVVIVPSFSTKGSSLPLQLLSVQTTPQSQQSSLGAFQAGLSKTVPLWLALLLEKRNLAQIVLPSWLSSLDVLQSVLEWEQSRESFSPVLPLYWQAVARALLHNSKNGGQQLLDSHHRAIQILLHDIGTVRMDKIRRNLHTLSKQSLSQTTTTTTTTSTLPIVTINGIGALELASIHSFVVSSFGSHLKLSRRAQTNTAKYDARTAGGSSTSSSSSANHSKTTTTAQDARKSAMKMTARSVAVSTEREGRGEAAAAVASSSSTTTSAKHVDNVGNVDDDDKTSDDEHDDDDSNEEEEEEQQPVVSTTRTSRLRRFR